MTIGEEMEENSEKIIKEKDIFEKELGAAILLVRVSSLLHLPVRAFTSHF